MLNIEMLLRALVPIEAKADGSGLVQFRSIAYKGGPLRVAGYAYPVVVDLMGLGLREQVPLLRDHDQKRVVGYGTPRIEGNQQLVLEGRILSQTQAGREALELHRSGLQFQASVGVSPERLELIGQDRRAFANGRQFVGPIYLATKSRLREVSLVAVGADPETEVAIAATAGVVATELSWRELQEDRQHAAIAACNELAALRRDNRARRERWAEIRAWREGQMDEPEWLAGWDAADRARRRLRGRFGGSL